MMRMLLKVIEEELGAPSLVLYIFMRVPRDRHSLWSLLLLQLCVDYKGGVSPVEPVAVLFKSVRIV
jgi:hypothetical protein